MINTTWFLGKLLLNVPLFKWVCSLDTRSLQSSRPASVPSSSQARTDHWLPTLRPQTTSPSVIWRLPRTGLWWVITHKGYLADIFNNNSLFYNLLDFGDNISKVYMWNYDMYSRIPRCIIAIKQRIINPRDYVKRLCHYVRCESNVLF